MSKTDRAQARYLRTQARIDQRREDQRDLKKLPWWQQRNVGLMVLALIRQWGRR